MPTLRFILAMIVDVIRMCGMILYVTPFWIGLRIRRLLYALAAIQVDLLAGCEGWRDRIQYGDICPICNEKSCVFDARPKYYRVICVCGTYDSDRAPDYEEDL